MDKSFLTNKINALYGKQTSVWQPCPAVEQLWMLCAGVGMVHLSTGEGRVGTDRRWTVILPAIGFKQELN